MFVLDTNTVIYFFKGMGGVAERLLSTPPGEIGLPTVVLFELQTGIAKSTNGLRRRQQLDALVRSAVVLPFGVDEARAAAGVRAAMERGGTPIGPIDNLIAGTAIVQNGALVTRNVHEFNRVPGLSVENWFDEGMK
ncbi:MAG: tRNA(fMet)-specific endonuclease VapC [Kiritimatiellia bacterium]|jgi:tRNA(fMet)-specific endonuclease VapC